MNNLKSCFDKIDNDYFIQINDDFDSVLKIGKYGNKYAFVVRGRSNRIKFKGSAFVTLLLSQLDNKEKQLVFILEKESLLEVFIQLIEDIKKSLKDNYTKNKLDIAYNRWLLWKELFSNGYKELLSEKEIQGLIGELLFLEQIMMNYYSTKEAVFSWGGANYNKKDFEFDKKWCEIKTILDSSTRVKISSLDQLNSKYIGYLVVNNLQKSTVNDISINLNDLVDRIIKKIKSPELVEIFINKLNEQGYDFKEIYAKYNYIVISRKFYLVNNEFPKLTINNTPESVVEAQYTIELLVLEKFLVNESEVFEYARGTNKI